MYRNILCSIPVEKTKQSGEENTKKTIKKQRMANNKNKKRTKMRRNGKSKKREQKKIPKITIVEKQTNMS